MNDWEKIAGHYRINRNAIYFAGPACWGVDRYAWDHEAGIRLTPIEFALWQDISHAAVVLYPQYPVVGFFVDFGNPCARVAIECDGAAWHRDRERDAIRQAAIEKQGWTIYRFTAKQCFAQDYEDELGLWRPNPTFLAIKEIGQRHGMIWGRSPSRSQSILNASTGAVA